MLSWVIDLLAVSGFLGLAALLLEHILRLRHEATRIPWLLAMAASLLVPLLASAIGGQPAARRVATEAVGIAPARAGNLTRPTTLIDMGAAYAHSGREHRRVEQLIFWLWASSTTLASAIVVTGLWQFRWRRRSWRAGTVLGQPVLIAPDAGPAVFGVFRPQIVVPEWLLRAPSDTQRLVIAHEQAHVEARDSGVLALSTILLLLAPWNLLLWWQSHRLHMAIEVDCDRRVLRRGFDLKQYAQVLLRFGLWRPNLPGATAYISESPSKLERRITLMYQARTARWTFASALLVVVSIGAAAAATRFIPPPLMLATASALGDSAALDNYVGSYEFASVTVLEIQRQRDHLAVVFPMAAADLLVGKRPDEFKYKDADVMIRFERDAAGQVTGLNFEQNGAVTHAPRIASARAQAIRSEIADRYRKQIAAAGSERALRGLIEGLQSGAPDYSLMSPQLAGGTRTSLKNFQSSMQPLGPIQSIEFKGVNEAGWDHYQVKYLHGAADWQIAVDDHGVIVGALTVDS